MSGGGGLAAVCRVVGRAGVVGSLVDVFAVDVDCIGDEGGAPFAVASVAALKTPDLNSGLNAVKDTHDD